MFPEKKYNYGIMKNLIHDIKKIANNFLEQENYYSKRNCAGIDLTEQYLSRGLYNLLEKKLSDLKKEFENSDACPDYYDNNLSLENMRLTYLILKHNLKDINKFDFEVQKAVYDLGRNIRFFIFTQKQIIQDRMLFQFHKEFFKQCVAYSPGLIFFVDNRVINQLKRSYQEIK